ncbi:MAG TPA: radical SAM protein [Candidatus Acidoferrum sp.]|nr:radical SAM protein [Candidatus Acidoferrum sp.]
MIFAEQERRAPPRREDGPLPKHGGSETHGSRPVLARHRAQLAQAMLADCRFCAHDCGANRRAGEFGLCHAGAETRFFCAQTEVSDELELIPTFAVALSGCDMRCDFCVTGASSWNARAGEALDPARMAARARTALQAGARTIMVLGGEPTIHLPAALEFVSLLPETARLVWKTNAHASAWARELLEGMFDVWVADFKFGNDACAGRLAKTPDYVRVVQGNLLWANEHSELIVRHLLMPGHVDCCWGPVAEWLAANLPGVKVNVRSGFWPAWQAGRHAELGRAVSQSESERAERIARASALNLIP